MKELRIKLDYLASTYGVDLNDARILLEEDGTLTLLLEGTLEKSR